MTGERIGHFVLEAELGSGGMGKVYRARVGGRVPGLAEGETVALKILHPHLLERPGCFRRFLREAEAGQTVRHPNVVRTLAADAALADGRQVNFLVMEYVEGQNLRGLLSEMGRVPEDLARHIAAEVAKGLAAIHRAGIVHRDLKPENVLITRDNSVKVMDLGVARLVDEAIRISETSGFVGSVLYAAPEMLSEAEVDGRVDLYALGLTLYELCAGRHPCTAAGVAGAVDFALRGQPRRLRELVPGISPYFDEVVHTLLAKDPGGRFRTADALSAALSGGEASPWWRDRSRGVREATRRLPRPLAVPRDTGVHGREAELARLADLLARARSGDGRAVILEGEAGIGKTRLVDEFVARAAAAGEDFEFLWGAFPPGGAATGSGPFREAVLERLGTEGLPDTLRRLLPSTPGLAPSYAAFLRGEPAPEGQEPLTRESMLTLSVHLARGLAAERPVVLLLDDLHLAPEDGRALFAALAMGAAGHRLLVLGTAHPGLPAAWLGSLERLPHVARLTLPRLGPKDLVGLLRDAFRSEHLAEELAGRIGAKSDGNPFFVFEILRGLAEGRLLERKPDGTVFSTRLIRDIEVPSTVTDLVRARLAGLEEEEQELLDVASCVGFTFDPDLVAAVAGQERIPALRRLARLERSARLVRAAGRQFAFDHHPVREAVYAAMPETLREEYHARIAQALLAREESAGGPAGAIALEVAGHLFRGRRHDLALHHLPAALEHLGRSFRDEAALDLLERALAAPGLLSGVERARRLLDKVACLDHLGRVVEQGAAAREAAALADETGDLALRARARQNLGHHLLAVGRKAEAAAALREAEALAVAAGDRKSEAVVIGNLALLALSGNRPEEAHAGFARRVAIARETGDRRGESFGLAALAQAEAALGRAPEARALLREAIEAARAAGSRRHEATARGYLGGIAFSEGLFAEAREEFSGWLALARETGDRRAEAAAVGSLGNVALFSGRFAEARECCERFLAVAREIGDRDSETRATGNLGNVAMYTGRLGEALSLYERHLALSRETSYRRGEAIALLNLGGLRTCLGDLEGGEASLRSASALLTATAAGAERGQAELGLAVVAEAAGRPEEATEYARRGRAEFGAARYRVGLAEADLVLGRLLLRAGRTEEARASFLAALEAGRRHGYPGAQVLAACRLAALSGEGAAAARSTFETLAPSLRFDERLEARLLLFQLDGDRAQVEEAWRELSGVRAGAPEEFRESLLARVPVHRSIVQARGAL